jgi:hypothetical protein
MTYFYGVGPNGRVAHLYADDSALSGLCGPARRISPTLTNDRGDLPACRSCQARAEARDEELFCLACGGKRVYLSHRRMRPDLVVCDDCGARRVASAARAAKRM